MKSPANVAKQLVIWLESDNGSKFETTPEQMAKLGEGARLMLEAGCPFTDEDYMQLTGGEVSEMADAYGKYNGFVMVNEALDDIFAG